MCGTTFTLLLLTEKLQKRSSLSQMVNWGNSAPIAPLSTASATLTNLYYIYELSKSKEEIELLISSIIPLLKVWLQTLQRSEETIRGYLVDITQLDRYLTEKYNCPIYIEDLTEDDIVDYLRMLRDEKGYKPASINRHLNSIRVLCKFAYRKDWIDENPTRNIDQLRFQRPERTFLTATELDDFINAIEQPLAQLAARTMAFTGLRVNECTNLSLSDVDLDNNVIHVVNGKGGKNRDIPISEALVPYLEDYLQNWRPNVTSDKFFATEKTGRISHQTINKALHQTTYKLGWDKKVTCHILRHSFASKLVANDVHVSKISKLLGHADVRTTSIYMHTSSQDLQEAVNLL